MNKPSLAAQQPQINGEAWEFYYLRKKRKAERTIQKFLSWKECSNLSPTVFAVVKYGVLQTGGKRIRPVLTYLIHDLVGGNNPYIDYLAILAELPHRGSLLEDDIDDHARQRDRKPPAFRLFGKEATMNACRFLYISPMLILNSLSIDNSLKQGVAEDYTRLSRRAREGQRKDLFWGKGNYIPSTKEYLRMCEEKCAAFEYAIRIGAIFGGATEKQTNVLVIASNKVATAFQLTDDLLSLREGNDDFGSDISEGKKTLPVIQALNKNISSQLLDILSLHTDDPDLIREAIFTINKAGGIKRTEYIASALTAEAILSLKNIFPDTRFRRILLSIIHYGITRNK